MKKASPKKSPAMKTSGSGYFTAVTGDKLLIQLTVEKGSSSLNGEYVLSLKNDILKGQKKFVKLEATFGWEYSPVNEKFKLHMNKILPLTEKEIQEAETEAQKLFTDLQ